MKRVLTLVLGLLLVLFLYGGVSAEKLVARESDSEELTVEGSVKVKGDYIIDTPDASWLSDGYLANNNSYSYLDSKENGTPRSFWAFPIGTHTPLVVAISYTNMSSEDVKALDRVNCKIVYADKYEFETTCLQVNPDQIDDRGKTGIRSMDGVPLKPLIGTKMNFIANVPLIVRDSDAALVAYITLDEEMTYTINLRDIIYTYTN